MRPKMNVLQLIILLLTLNLNLTLIMVNGQVQRNPVILQSRQLATQSNDPQPSSSETQSNDDKAPRRSSLISLWHSENENPVFVEEDKDPRPIEQDQNPLTTAQDQNLLKTEQETKKRPEFFRSLLQHLDERRSNENNTIPVQDQLTLTVTDGSLNSVSIKFVPNSYTPEAEETWDSIVEFIADSLANIIQEVERLGYTAKFDYDISLLNAMPLAYGPGLSAGSLKSAVG